MLLDREQLEIAVHMHAKSYALLKWVAQAVTSGTISFGTAHQYASLPIAAKDWIEKHYLNFPEESRVEFEDITTFANFFSTYLENSFDLVSNPGWIKFSPRAHCFCPMCSWMIEAPRLKTKLLTASDKKRATKMQCHSMIQLAIDTACQLDETKAQTIVDDEVFAESTASLAYGHDLVLRLDGVATGPAVLALWRRFAWTKMGSPKKQFRLQSELMLKAESRLIEFLKGLQK
jgi:hypothetical protein